MAFWRPGNTQCHYQSLPRHHPISIGVVTPHVPVPVLLRHHPCEVHARFLKMSGCWLTPCSSRIRRAPLCIALRFGQLGFDIGLIILFCIHMPPPWLASQRSLIRITSALWSSAPSSLRQRRSRSRRGAEHHFPVCSSSVPKLSSHWTSTSVSQLRAEPRHIFVDDGCWQGGLRHIACPLFCASGQLSASDTCVEQRGGQLNQNK